MKKTSQDSSTPTDSEKGKEVPPEKLAEKQREEAGKKFQGQGKEIRK